MRKILSIGGCFLLGLACSCAGNRGQQATNPHPFVFGNQFRYVEGVMQSPSERIQAEGASAKGSIF